LETQAKLRIQQLVVEGHLDLVWSFILQYENDDNPCKDQKERISIWKDIAKECVILSDEINAAANNLRKLNLRTKDALHVACAIHAQAVYFISTDKRLLNKPIDKIKLVSPVKFLEVYYDKD
jgi:predicted nucleic acid-binding protein